MSRPSLALTDYDILTLTDYSEPTQQNHGVMPSIQNGPIVSDGTWTIWRYVKYRLMSESA